MKPIPIIRIEEWAMNKKVFWTRAATAAGISSVFAHGETAQTAAATTEASQPSDTATSGTSPPQGRLTTGQTTSQESEQLSLEEVVVTAQRRAERLEDV